MFERRNHIYRQLSMKYVLLRCSSVYLVCGCHSTVKILNLYDYTMGNTV
jgi:hypothetical protein